ncbi:magnesium transporter CorA family protein [Massiliimalia massiliensis]|jgi:magnesium transporter|uniref:magnesium transporter CorA family protein n=1 Tax=Massiliimalia massiliensis TaxID=1852384 RepID=UPI000985949E|nr:magnesium transporter CorA family protein [Massiliimalia massiliensis]
MISYYQTEHNKMVKISEFVEGCWVNVISPSAEEIAYLVDRLKLDRDFVRAALDEEESSRIENEDDQTLVLVDIPIMTSEDNNTVLYTTRPLGIIMTETNIITISLQNNPVINDFANGVIRNIQTQLKTRFLLRILLRGATQYLTYLKQIDKITSSLESKLDKSMKNRLLMQLLGLEKSLVYFSTSLKADEITLEKILRGRVIKMYEEDQDLLEDVLIEVKQAIEMSSIYSRTLSSTMDAFSSVINNNLNIVMKILTAVTVLLEIPNMVFSFYGMNIDGGLWLDQFDWAPLLVAGVLTGGAAIILYKARMFK